MKYIMLFLTNALMTFLVQAQEGNRQVTYRFIASDGEQKLMKLYYNDSSSLFVYNKEGWDTGFSAVRGMNYNDSLGMYIKLSDCDAEGQMIYRHFPSRTITLRQTKVGALDAFTASDTWLEIDWKIGNNKKKIKGLECRKATGHFRGRTYTAWFAEMIPVPYGPWKLFGLPGLIVAAYDKEKIFNIEIITAPVVDSLVAILPPVPIAHKQIKAYVYYLDHRVELMYEQMKVKLPEGMSAGPLTVLTSHEELRKASFEKEYEWEREDKHELPQELNLLND